MEQLPVNVHIRNVSGHRACASYSVMKLVTVVAVLVGMASIARGDEPTGGNCPAGRIAIAGVSVIPTPGDPLSGVVRVSTFYEGSHAFVRHYLQVDMKGSSVYDYSVSPPPGAQTYDFFYDMTCNLSVAEDRAAVFDILARTESADYPACNHDVVETVTHPVDPKPRVTNLARTAILPSGSSIIEVGFESSLQKDLVVVLFFDGVPWNFQHKNERSGTAVFETSFGCIREGEHTISAEVNACYDINNRPRHPNYGSDRVTMPLNVPQANIGIALRRLTNGDIEATIDYTIPPDTGTWDLDVASLARYSEDGTFRPAGVIHSADVTESGRAVKIFTPPVGARQIVANGVLSSCHGRHEDSSAVNCFVCNEAPDSTGDPVAFIDGDMRYTDHDPLPPQLDSIALTRTYDSHHQVNALFGRGWMSMFDRRLWVTNAGANELVYFTTESNDAVIFRKTSAGYVQHWPKGQPTAGALRKDTTAGVYIHRAPGATSESLFRVNDGRFAGLRQLGTGRQLTVDYNASGVPSMVVDSWTGLTWTIAVDGGNRRIGSITIGDIVWSYTYDASGNLTAVNVSGSPWRSYEYASNRMTKAQDADAKLIEEHAFDANGYATSSTGPNDEIALIAYDQTVAGRPDARATHVTAKNGTLTKYILAPVGAAWRTVQVIGGCASCGSSDALFVYDANGRIVRQQQADGYVTLKTYSGDRLASVQTPMLRQGCDPEADANRCRVDDLTLAASTLEPIAGVTMTTTYAYGDAVWPDRVTKTTTPSIAKSGESRNEEVQYHPLLGAVRMMTVSGWAGAEQLAERTTSTSFYGDGTSGDDGGNPQAPLFDPGFNPAWLTLPQPPLRRSIDGPRTDVEDVTSFVYYPVDASVPANLRGRLAAARNAAGHLTKFESYDVFGNATRMVDPNGVATEMTYDALGRLRTSTVKGIPGCDTTKDSVCGTDLTTTRTYKNVTGPLEKEERPGGGVTVYAYDARGRLSTISRGPAASDLREQMAYEYDPLTGKKSTEILSAREGTQWAEKKRESYAYNADALLQSIAHADDNSIAYTYDAADRLSAVRDENHTEANTFYAYDAAGRLATVRQTLGANSVTTQYAYDLHGNLASVTDPNGNVTTYIYDDFGELVRQQSPVTGVIRYEYDHAGDLISTTDANNAVTQRAYDALGRVMSAVSTRDSAVETVTWAYDAADLGIGRLASMSDPAGSTSYQYERRGLLREETRRFGVEPAPGNGRESAAPHVAVTKFTYDRDGNRASITYPSALKVDYSFDYAGRPLTASGFVTSARYLPFGPVTKLQFPNDTRQELDYDTRYQMKRNELKAGHNSLFRYSYHRDAAGNITKINETGSDGSENTDYDRRFAYDDLNRLITADTGKISEQRPGGPPSHTGSVLWRKGSYTWDAMGNILSLKLGEIDPNDPPEPEPQRGRPKPPDTEANIPRGRTSFFTYVRRGDPPVTTPLLETVTTNDVTRTVEHDGAGNETTYYVHREYSPRNLLARVIDPLEPGFEPHTVAYAYDGRGIRVMRAESPSDGLTARRYYTYSPEFRLLAVTADDVFNVWETSTPYEIIWFGDRPVAQVTAGQPVRYTVADHLGTPFLQTDAAATIVWRAEYEPFGNVFEMRAGHRTDQPLRLPGQELAMTWEGPEENYNIFRWYRSSFGRMTQPDPRGLEALREAELYGVPFTNLYSYVDGNPLTRIDPWGDAWQEKYPNWLPFSKYIKCSYYWNKCFDEVKCCVQKYNLSTLSEEEAAELYATANPAYTECFLKNSNCEKAGKYCVEVGKPGKPPFWPSAPKP